MYVCVFVWLFIMCIIPANVCVSLFPSSFFPVTLRITFWVTYCSVLPDKRSIRYRSIDHARTRSRTALIGSRVDFRSIASKKEPSTSNRTFGFRVLFRRPTERGSSYASALFVGHKFTIMLTLSVSLIDFCNQLDRIISGWI